MLGAVLSFLQTSCEPGPEEVPPDNVSVSSEALFGASTQNDTTDYVRAVAQMLTVDGWNCSGSLVASDKILTAAHCLCHGSPAYVWFADNGGSKQVDSNGNLLESWPVLDWWFPANAKMCGDYVTWSDDDPDNHSAWNIAILQIGKSTQQNRLPPFPQTPILLGDPTAAWTSGRIQPFPVDPSDPLRNTYPGSYYQAVGYGTNGPQDMTQNCFGCSTRRLGLLTNVSFGNDTCGIASWDCYNTPIFRASSAKAGNTAEASGGDSGGPLVFLDTVTNKKVIGAVYSGYVLSFISTEGTKMRWAPTGTADNADLLWQTLGLPYTETLNSIKQHVAIYARAAAYVDDRAKVIKVVNGVQLGVDVLAGSAGMRIGADAIAGNVRARGNIELADRSQVGSVISTGSVVRGMNVTASSIVQAEYMRFEDFSLSAPAYTSVGPSATIESGNTVPLPPGKYGYYSVRGGGVLNIAPGLYQFADLNLESNSIVRRTDINANAKTWIFIYQSGYSSINLKGKLLAPDGAMFIGIPGNPSPPPATYVFINDQFDATLVAPNAWVDADLSSQHASLVGSIFGDTVYFHQGAVLGYIPFTSNWTPVCTSGGGFTNCN
jgi:hypothetical protein